MAKSGSPRGTIHIYNSGVDGIDHGPSEDEITKKQDLRGSIGDELEERALTADTFYQRDIHPYMDSSPRDETKHIFVVYPETIQDREIDGRFFLVVDELGLEEKEHFDFWGTTYDFVAKLVQEIPELDKIILNVCDNKVPGSIVKVIEHELWKRGIDTFSADTVSYNNKPKREPEGPEEGNITVNDLGDAIQDPGMRSMMQDPYHNSRGQKLSSRVNRILRIAWHVIQTPADEVDGPEDRWSIVPDKPSEENEKEAIEKFKSRDDAVVVLNELKGKPVDDEDEEDKSINASILTEWLSPEEAAKAAWSLREKKKPEGYR